jgi:hypothetical protein
MIYGTTHDDKGKAIQSVQVTHRLAIGLRGEKAPTKLDHFVVQSRDKKKGEWFLDEDATKALAQAHGCAVKELTQVRIFLLSDQPESAFDAELALRSGRMGKILCKGNGKIALRREDLALTGKMQPWEPCGGDCPELEAKQCKPSGKLFFQLGNGPLAGRLCMIQTTSWNSVRALSGAIGVIHEATGGLLRGIPLWLSVGPKRTTYGADAKATTIYTYNLEYIPHEPGREAAEMIDYARAARGQIAELDELPDEDEADERYTAEMFHPETPDDVIASPSAIEPEVAAPTPDDVPLPDDPPADPDAPTYTWDDVPDGKKRVVAWYLQQATGKTGRAAVEAALAKATKPMEVIVAKAEAAFAAQEGKS